jgi:TonB family protein
MGVSLRAFASILCVTSTLAPAAPLVPRQPAGPWKLEYTEAQCVVSREYGTADRPLDLALVPSANGGVMRIMFIRRGYDDPNEEPAQISFGSGKPIDTNVLTYAVTKNKHRVVSINMDMSEFRSHIAEPSITIRSHSISQSFGVSDLPALMGELDKCLADLQEYWNVKSAGPAIRMATPSRGAGIFSAADYPWMAIRANQTGTVGVSVLVDQQGNVADCSVDKTSGVAVLDVVTCYIFEQRAKFLPATDKDGKAVRSTVVQNITWRIAS